MSQKLYLSAGLVILIIVAVNLVGHEFHLRLDFTEDQEYTLSDATGNILEELEDPVTVKAYFSQNMPPDIARTRQDFQEMLIEYANRSDGKVVYEFINPNASDADEKEAINNGVQPVMINVREKDQMKQQKAFLGAVLTYDGKQEVIPFVHPGAAMEYALSTAIKKLSVKERPLIGFLSGHGEAPLDELIEAREALSVLYTTQEVRLSDTTDIPPAVKTLVIVRPTDSIPASHLARLDAFMARGGNVVVAINRVDGNLQNATGSAIATGMEKWLATKGLEVQDDFVVDAKCAAITVQQQMAFGMMQQQLQFPYLPVIASFSGHPIAKGLEAVVMQFASTIRFVGDTSKRFTPLAFTSGQSNALKAPQYFDIQKQWTEADFPQQQLVVAALVEGKFSGNTRAGLVVVGDGDFPINGPQQQARRLQPDNVHLLVNSVDYLSDDTGLIDLRTKGATARPIHQLEDGTKTLLKYTNFLLPVLLAVGYGVYRAQRNKMKRYKWMSENYEEA
ncbi:MAG: GldG family protein [Cyclobacteriaceae bacterium]|nr:GldG family protein [Cyclobacteriaceae bacterium]